MIVLGLDTTGPDCSVSIVDDAAVRAHLCEHIGRGHAERLASMVADALDRAGLSPTDIDRIAVCSGPGSFTGLRVALAFAKGFALPRGLPVLGIDALAVTAQNIRYREDDHLIGVVRDIRRDEVFFAIYSHGEAMDSPQAMSLTDAQARADDVQAAIYDAAVDTRILAWLAIDADPDRHPAEPLYSRGPDAKLPGGKSL